MTVSLNKGVLAQALKYISVGFVLALLLAFAIGTARYGWRENAVYVKALMGNQNAQAIVSWLGHVQWACADENRPLKDYPECQKALTQMPEL